MSDYVHSSNDAQFFYVIENGLPTDVDCDACQEAGREYQNVEVGQEQMQGQPPIVVSWVVLRCQTCGANDVATLHSPIGY